MESPFEIAIPQVEDDLESSVRGISDKVRVRSRTRHALKNRKVTTRWNKKRDILWQQNPDRVLKYRPSHLHYYGWIPFGIFRNVKATVFSEVYLHVQTVVLLLWMGLIHWTGLGVDDKDLAAFVSLFSTAFLGAIFNYGMVVVFILGLFITLVINRWWSIRSAYAKLMGTTTDLCMVVASAIHSEDDPEERRTNRARTEITRLLNLGHLLVVTRADAQNDDFLKSYGLRTLMKSFVLYIRTLIHFQKAPDDEQGSQRLTHALYKPRKIALEDLLDEGFLNEDEWTLLTEGEAEGMPAYHLVYYWTQALINRCKAAGWIISAPQLLPLMLNKVQTIVESGSQIITTVNSQMPYPYVHLVSFVVHMYLIVLATWFGSYLHTGIRGRSFVIEGDLTGSLEHAGVEVKDSVWIVFWCYVLMGVANVTFQGLLDMHTLLDNPFGNHCAKFPLRAHVGGVTNASRTMLTMADKFPAAFGDVFQCLDCTDAESCKESSRVGKPSIPPSEFADFLNPTSTSQFPLASIGSWTFNEKERGRRPNQTPVSTIREKFFSTPNQISRIKKCRSQPVDKVPHQFTPEPPLTPQEARKGSRPQEEVTFQNLRTLNGEQPERQGPRQSTGDPEIQEKFLQGAVEDAIQHSFNGLQDSAQASTSKKC
eukprot:g4458.t1